MKKKRNNRVINLFILILFFISIFLGYKINEKKKFFDLPPIHTWIPYENWFKSNDDLVSTTNQYYHLIDNYYTNGSSSCISLFDGIEFIFFSHDFVTNPSTPVFISCTPFSNPVAITVI